MAGPCARHDDRTAVVLFTSGSESLPKAVPLTHLNLLTNIRDALSSFEILQSDRMLGLLPPFHSFGLMGTLLLPILAGVRVVHHPNPNEVSALAKIIEKYRVTLLLGTPTFVANIVRASAGADLTSLRLCVTGAEKCPRETYDSLKSRCPKAVILEGYGITECSPVVAVTREDDVQPGTIGKPLPSVTALVMDFDTGQPAAPGRTGMLLLRGPSIFGGYLNYSGPSPFQTFRGESWYRTGDLVKADDQNRLTFIGRLKRFVKIGGEMVSLPAIEDVLMSAYARQDEKARPWPCCRPRTISIPNSSFSRYGHWTARRSTRSFKRPDYPACTTFVSFGKYPRSRFSAPARPITARSRNCWRRTRSPDGRETATALDDPGILESAQLQLSDPQQLPEHRIGVLTERRRALVTIDRRLRESDRIGDELEHPRQRVRHRDDHAALTDLRVGENLGELVYRTARYIGDLQNLEPVRLVLGREHRLEHRRQRLTILDAPGGRAEARIVRQPRLADRGAEALPLQVVSDRQHDQSIRALKCPRRRTAGADVAPARRGPARDQVLHTPVAESRHHRIEQRDIDVLSLPSGVRSRWLIAARTATAAYRLVKISTMLSPLPSGRRPRKSSAEPVTAMWPPEA